MQSQLARGGAVAVVSALLVCVSGSASAQNDKQKKSEPKRPSVSLKLTPSSGMVPVRISALAELKGGDDDYEEFYCPTIEWNWGDGTISESSSDCDPYETGKSQVRRRYTVSHLYKRADRYQVSFKLKQKEKVVAAATTVVQLLGGSPF